MTKPQLRLLAIVLSGLILVVLFAGLDDLPRQVRAEIASEQQSLAAAETEFQKARGEVTGDLRAEPELFRVHAMDTTFPVRLARVDGNLQAARKDMAALAVFLKANRRADQDRAERLLREERGLRANANSETTQIEREARHWLDVKHHLPEQVVQMERDYQAVRSADLAKVTAAVQQAESDWPEKRPDLEARLAALRTAPSEVENEWQSTAAMRRKVAANDLAGLDYAALVTAADSLHQAAADVPQKSRELQELTGQLYNSWDKILVDLEIRRSGERRFYDEKIRTVRAHLVDVAAKKSETTTEEQWVDVSPAQYAAVESDLGMAVEHKAAGKYDSEAERVAQPAGFAYMAPPAQGSNQYGYWEHRNGSSFWIWFPQYLLLRDLLWNHSYPPLSTREYEEYRTARTSGHTYYGRDESEGAPKYGSQGTFTQRRYADSNYARSGGYRDSRYASKGGGYRGSRFESPSSRSGQNDSEPHRFGRPPEHDSPHSFRSPGSGSRPTPRSSPRPGRSFGGRRR
jgi:hypothetical protein